MANIKKCRACTTYTLEATCPECGADTGDPSPPPLSVPDRYGDYRRAAKRETDTNDT